ncbi:hypothetical protein CSC62_05135 [Pseudoxanthomonas jiangsuensis]|uniref:helix-turn-helix domain-containing protein n=1 Tax=Pseudoxanthomonas jiangsuensis TaxID=619688 RepID=UPI001391957D|nr:hypothetical protein CSC62_05135 [Pseudoxanthomonas jiangsuensis]
MRIGTRIRQSRSRIGLSIRDLAHHLGVSHATVGHWETGRHNPSIATLCHIAEITGVDPAWLMTGHSEFSGRVLVDHETKQIGGGLAFTPHISLEPLATFDSDALGRIPILPLSVWLAESATRSLLP